MDPVIVVFGFGVGLLIGMTGMGGGSLMTPLLILLFGVQPVTAVGTDIFYGAVTKTRGGMASPQAPGPSTGESRCGSRSEACPRRSPAYG